MKIYFFRNQYGLDIIVPKLRQILPWLSILDDKIREKVQKVAPEILFEGGDPVQLPLEIRRKLLFQVCEQMAEGTANRSIQHYEAVQRFADSDLTNDISELLRKYKENEELTAFLLRMVWLGPITKALPEAMDVALTPTAEHYARLTAFKAVKAIGSKEDKDHVRQSFLAEAPILNREWLSELTEGIKPTQQTVAWLLASLEKCEPKERYSYDSLRDGVIKFVSTASMELLPHFVTGLNRLLSLPPLIERRFCEVSEKFQWLMTPAVKAVERLILTRHPASLEQDALAILHKFSAMFSYRSDELVEPKADFSKIVPAWEDLNRSLFWFNIQNSRKTFDKRNAERLINYWQASIVQSFWRFEEKDFDYVAGEISRQKNIDDKLVALSLAFQLYILSGRPRKLREQLKKLVSSTTELNMRLKNLLRPPAQNQKERRWKQQEANWKKRQESQQKKIDQHHENWKRYFENNLDKERAEQSKKPGMIRNSLNYLYRQAIGKNQSSTRWTEYNWKKLVPEYGEDVARFYRNSTVSFWRNYLPNLRSEGAPLNQTTLGVTFGLTGLEIEAYETKNWPKNLNPLEVELACRYASFELNGFPTWFPKLFEAHPKIVCDFILQEIRYELSLEKIDKEIHYIISDVSWSGQWAWDKLAMGIYDCLKKEPKNLSNLDELLKIFQGSSISDDIIKKLAARKCRTLKKIEHLSRWFAVWTGVAPGIAITALKSRIDEIVDPEKRTLFAMTFATNLLGGHRSDTASVRESFKSPEYLKSLYLLMHEHIRREDDINRADTGVYSPELRDHAQDARNNLFQLLNQIPGKETFLALMDISKAHPEETYRPWILNHAKVRAEQDGDIEPWAPSQVWDFHENIDRTPHNHRELAELAALRIQDLKNDLEHGDSSIASILKNITQEPDMRKYIGHELREKSFGRYSITQEEEFADGKKPDLRFHGMGFDQPVPTELKLADNWTGPQLFERLENQLCSDYLRDDNSKRGIFVLVYRGEKTAWEIPVDGNRLNFDELTIALQNHWWHISSNFPKVDDIMVIGIDLTKRSS